MKIKDWIIVGLLIALAAVFLFRKVDPPADFTSIYDSLNHEIKQRQHVIDSARIDSVRESHEILILKDSIVSVLDDLGRNELAYQKKIKSLERLKMPDYDSLTLARYGEPLSRITAKGALLMYNDILSGEACRIMVADNEKLTSMQGEIIRSQEKIIRSDGVRLHASMEIIETQNLLIDTKDLEIAPLKALNKKLVWHNKLLKVAIPVGVIGTILIFK